MHVYCSIDAMYTKCFLFILDTIQHIVQRISGKYCSSFEWNNISKNICFTNIEYYYLICHLLVVELYEVLFHTRILLILLTYKARPRQITVSNN